SDRARDVLLTAADGIDAIMTRERLDAIMFPGGSAAQMGSRPGYPTVIVPYTTFPNRNTPDYPAGFDAKPIPYGVSFTGMACAEPKLLAIAYAFEQATKKRVPPAAVP